MPLKASTLETIFFLLHRSFYAMVSHQVPLTQKEHLSEVSKSGFIGLQNIYGAFLGKKNRNQVEFYPQIIKKTFLSISGKLRIAKLEINSKNLKNEKTTYIEK